MNSAGLIRSGLQALAGLLALISSIPTAGAAEALIAVAANFAAPAAELKTAFEAAYDHRLVLTSGSTGKLYAQIRNGAPFDVFLAADTARPARLEEETAAVAGSRFTYARGRIGIWIPGATGDTRNHPTRISSLNRVALANPALAPYGAAAINVLDHLSIHAELGCRLAMGENVAQAYAMVASGAAQGGLVAWSMILAGDTASESWLVPESWHQSVDQDAVLLMHGRSNDAAMAFLQYLRSPTARTFIQSLGYSVP